MQHRNALAPSQDGYWYGGIPVRKPYKSELDFFNKTGIPGYAAADDRVVLNPNAENNVNMDSIHKNEASRIIMRTRPDMVPPLDLTDEQTGFLDATTYKAASPEQRAATIMARLISGDNTGGAPTSNQLEFMNRLRRSLYSNQGK